MRAFYMQPVSRVHVYVCVCVPPTEAPRTLMNASRRGLATNELDSLEICGSPLHSKMGSSAIPFAACHNDPTIPIHLVSFFS